MIGWATALQGWKVKLSRWAEEAVFHGMEFLLRMAGEDLDRCH